jgi:putative hemolysin
LGEKYLAPENFRTQPKAPHRCLAGEGTLRGATPDPPRLFRAYLDISARLCGPPAIDREFGTIDFLTLLDLQAIPQRLRTRFF